MRYANSLVGNALQTPVLELTMTGPRLICESAGKVALAGAQFAARVNNQSVDSRQAIALAAGDELSFEPPTTGVRGYLAVEGAWRVKTWLGSASALRIGSYELLASAVWQAQDVLETRSGGVIPWPKIVLSPTPSTSMIRAYRGPEYDRLEPSAVAQLIERPLTVMAPSNRIGIRTNTTLSLRHSAHSKEMVSSGVQPGTVQVTHDGQAIILLADAQTIGGYPRVLQCASRSIDDLAQLRVGDQLSLTLLDYPTV
jgi:antagonist of KipI